MLHNSLLVAELPVLLHRRKSSDQLWVIVNML